jgi:hypothetical protein
MLVAVFLLFKTSLTDPGVIPRIIDDSLEPKFDMRNLVQTSLEIMGRNSVAE